MIFQNPYVFGSLIVALTSVLVYGFQYTVEPQRGEANRKLLYKILLAGLVSVFILGWLIHRPDPVLTDPFPIDG